MTKSERWILSEWQVAFDRATRFNDELVLHRERTPFAEVDLVLRSQRAGLVMIEVKTRISIDVWAIKPVSREQARRLRKAREFLETRYRCEVRLLLAVVSQAAAIDYFEPDHGWLLT